MNTKSYNNIKIIKSNINKGYSSGNNLGIQYALKKEDCQYIWILNNDVLVKSDSLEELDINIDIEVDSDDITDSIEEITKTITEAVSEAVKGISGKIKVAIKVNNEVTEVTSESGE